MVYFAFSIWSRTLLGWILGFLDNRILTFSVSSRLFTGNQRLPIIFVHLGSCDSHHGTWTGIRDAEIAGKRSQQL
jgi:hypothetical protein